MAKTFEFTNTNYIKKYPDIFLETLKENFKNTFAKESISMAVYANGPEPPLGGKRRPAEGFGYFFLLAALAAAAAA